MEHTREFLKKFVQLKSVQQWYPAVSNDYDIPKGPTLCIVLRLREKEKVLLTPLSGRTGIYREKVKLAVLEYYKVDENEKLVVSVKNVLLMNAVLVFPKQLH